MLSSGKLLSSFLLIFVFSRGAFAAQLQLPLNKLQLMAENARLYDDPLWHALLELKQVKPVNTERYLLSEPFTPRNELMQTLAVLANGSQDACRYPARAQFLENALALQTGTLFKKQHCPDYSKYLEAVPNDALYLVYASENVTSASSMMGHAMLRVDGKNASGIDVKHGITFFTELNSLNIPKLMFETLISGKEGIFKVAPYAPYQHFYRVTEQRNVWEYELALTDFERDLIRARIWELQYENPDYFFDKYNCATLTNLLLGLARPDSIDNLSRVITPLDVARYAQQNSLISGVRLIPSSKWKVHSIARSLSTDDREILLQRLITGKVLPVTKTMDSEAFVKHEYLKSLNILLHERGDLSSALFHQNRAQLEDNDLHSGDFTMSVGNTVAPSSRPLESRIAFGVQHLSGEQFATFDYYPVANSLSNDNRSVFGETQLILSDIGLRASLETGDTYLDRFMLYNMVSRVPYELENPDLSSSFKIGITRVFDDRLTQQLIAISEGAIGITKTLSSKAGVFAELGVGLSTELDGLDPFIAPRIGVYAYLSNAIKLNMEYRFAYNQIGEQSALHSVDFQMIYTLKSDFQIEFDIKYLDARHASSSLLAVKMNYLF